MPKLLRIDASPRVAGSHSRTLGDQAEQNWRELNPLGEVVTRDVSTPDIPPISAETITGFYTPAEAMTPELKAATALSDNLIAELQSADCLLLTVPMYNFGVPAGLKAWIDQITRIGHTFAYENGAFSGLVKTQRAIVICAYGADGYASGGPMASADFVKPYLQFLLGFLGVEEVEFVTVEATTSDEETVAERMKAATSSVQSLFQQHAA